MKFKKFPSIENHYREKYIEILKEHKFNNLRYVATEKIHGANFSFWTDGNDVRVASRSQFVDGTFYNCQEVIDQYSEKVLDLYNSYIFTNDNEEHIITVYGELYGPGIQSGIYYGDKKNFRAFDLTIDDKFISPITARYLLKNHSIPLVPIIGTYDSLDEALEESNIFQSKIWKMDQDPSENTVNKFTHFKEGENFAEGLVIQPLSVIKYTNNGSRVLIKSKNPKFTEKNKKRPSKPSEPNPFIPVVEQYVNENRMNSVLSKFGEATNKDFGKIIKLMNEDVIEDMIKDGDLPEDWKKQDEYKLAGKAVSNVVSNFLKENLLKKL